MNRRAAATTTLGVIGAAVMAAALFGGDATATAPPLQPPQLGRSAGAGACLDLNADFTDGEIAQVLFVLHANEVREARASQQKLMTEEARLFADEMIKVHLAEAQTLAHLVDRRRIDPVDSALSVQLRVASRSALSDLRDAGGVGDNTDVGFVNFDTAFLQQQRDAHEQALALIDNQLLPSASDPLLVANLFDTRDMVVAHVAQLDRLLE